MKPYETPEIREKLNILKDAVLRVAPDAESIYLFGSYANGTPRKDSDLDIYVVVPEGGDNPLDVEAAITEELYGGGFRIPIDLIVKQSGKFLENKERATFDKVVARTGVKIYG
jgi:predicted nucleotidyltransferase